MFSNFMTLRSLLRSATKFSSGFTQRSSTRWSGGDLHHAPGAGARPFLSRSGRKLTGMMTRPNHDDLVFLKDLIEAGHFVPIVDRCYPMAQAVDAHRYVLEGHVRGK